MFFKSKKVLGLDIGTTTIKMAEMDVSGRGASLEGFSFVQTPPHSVSAEALTDTGSISATIMKLVENLSTKRKHVCTGMSGTAVIVKKIAISKADRKRINEMLSTYAEQYIPFDINNVSLSYVALETTSSPDTIDVLLVAAQNELVSQYTQVVNMAGLDCSILDVSGFALANCFEANYGKLRGETVGVINFGASISNFVVISSGEVVFSRDIPVGGANYTSEISKSMGATLDEAETHKRSAVYGREVPEGVHAAIETTNEMIAEEVRNTLDFLTATGSSAALNRLFYTGGSSVTTGLVPTVQKVTGVATEPFNPFQRVRFNSRRLSQSTLAQVSPFVSVAMGLGMRSLGDK